MSSPVLDYGELFNHTQHCSLLIMYCASWQRKSTEKWNPRNNTHVPMSISVHSQFYLIMNLITHIIHCLRYRRALRSIIDQVVSNWCKGDQVVSNWCKGRNIFPVGQVKWDVVCLTTVSMYVVLSALRGASMWEE